jgi:CcmD family protein
LRQNGGEFWRTNVVANLTYLFAAYTAVWVLLFVYVLILSGRNRMLQKEIDELRQLLRRRSGS